MGIGGGVLQTLFDCDGNIFSEFFCCLAGRGAGDVRCVFAYSLYYRESCFVLLWAFCCTASKPGRCESLSSCVTCGIEKCFPICASPLLLPSP